MLHQREEVSVCLSLITPTRLWSTSMSAGCGGGRGAMGRHQEECGSICCLASIGVMLGDGRFGGGEGKAHTCFS